tara:strand:+ start:629 stop:784 length:156 start_codon:yes stop_codon:yes gene_type:complete
MSSAREFMSSSKLFLVIYVFFVKFVKAVFIYIIYIRQTVAVFLVWIGVKFP